MANNGIYYSTGHSLNFTTTGTTWATLNSGGTFAINTVSGGTYLNLPVSAVTGGSSISVTGSNGNYTISYTGSTGTSGDYLPLSGGTVTGGTVFISGVTANTLSSIDYIDFDVTAATPTHTEGRLHWIDDTKTLQIDTDVNNFMIEVGHQNVVRVRNITGSPIAKGRLVFINGGSGNRPTVTLANYSGDSTSARTLGFVAEEIGNNNNGYVITYGLIRGTTSTPLDTSAYSAGTQLYLYTGGTFTNTRPVAPLHEVRVGVVIASNANEGVIFVSIMNGYELEELHDVRISGKSEGDLVVYDSTLNVWENSKTLNGSYQITGTLSANTISATTYQNLPGSSSANCFTTFYVTNISGCSPVNVLSPLNVKDGLSVTGTSTFTSQANFTGGLSANTFSAGTYQNLPSFNSVQIDGTTQFSGDTNNFINFSGINITITSAATNTLVFSAGTGGGGGISGSGTANYLPKFTSSSAIGNSQLQDDGTQVYTNQGYVSTLTGNLSINASGTTGIAGRATQYGLYGGISGTTASSAGVYGEASVGQYGVYGNNIGDTAGTYIGVFGNAAQSDSGVAGTTYIGGKFKGDPGTSSAYSLWLEDGTEGVGKVLVSQTSDGKANWNTFSGINITITSAATNTIVFSAATGGGGGVSQIIAGTNITISPTGGTGAVTINSTGGGGGGASLGTVYTTANNFNFL